jgi:hypothetical protein
MNPNRILALSGGFLALSLAAPKRGNLENILSKEASAQTITVPGAYSQIDVSSPIKAFEAMMLSVQKKDVEVFKRVVVVSVPSEIETDNEIQIGKLKQYKEYMKEVQGYRMQLTQVHNLTMDYSYGEVDLIAKDKKRGTNYTLSDFIFFERDNDGRWKCMLDDGDAQGNDVIFNFIWDLLKTRQNELLSEARPKIGDALYNNLIRDISNDRFPNLMPNQKAVLKGVDRVTFPKVLSRYFSQSFCDSTEYNLNNREDIGYPYFFDTLNGLWLPMSNVPLLKAIQR